MSDGGTPGYYTMNDDTTKISVARTQGTSGRSLSERAGVLEEWWSKVTEEEIMAVVPKTVEYGGGDLDVVGYELARIAGRSVTREEAFELGIYFYVRGKMGRWAAAIADDRRVSSDTIHDIGIYVKMVQRVRTVGSWPGV